VILTSVERKIVDELSGERIFGPVYLLKGGMEGRILFSNSLLILGKKTVLIDAGMQRSTAVLLKDLRIVSHLHLTHYHLDHRIHQDFFTKGTISIPALEKEPFLSWEKFYAYTGLPEEIRPLFDGFREGLSVTTLEGRELLLLKEGDLLPSEVTGRFISLPGHTVGHSGIFFPEFSALMITDYDLLPFGPWYGNTASDLDLYEESYRRIASWEGIELYITSHRRGVVKREEFSRYGERFMKKIQEREERIFEEISTSPGITLSELAQKGIIYPKSSLLRNPVLVFFEGKMIEHHLKRLLRKGEILKKEDRYFLP
jgi:glyoxylase-like metal-dependent hydrolase (beta-lactamase superfamily II)